MPVINASEIVEFPNPCLGCGGKLYYRDTDTTNIAYKDPYRCASCDNYKIPSIEDHQASVSQWFDSDLYVYLSPLPKVLYWDSEKNKYLTEKFVQALCNRYSFITLMGSKIVFFYDWNDGYYKEYGIDIIEAEVERTFGTPSDNVIAKIIRMVKNHTLRNPDCWLDTISLSDETRSRSDKAKWLNFKNCVYNLDNGLIYPHSPGFLFISQIPINYNPNAECPEILKFFAQILDKQYLNLILEWFGYNLYASLPFQKSLICLGSGSNGKGTFLALLRRFIGSRNTTSTSMHEFTEKFTKYQLYGKKANIQGDLDPRMLKETATLKKLTGVDPIPAERKQKDPFDFICYAKISCSANKAPAIKIREQDRAFFRRWIILRFMKEFPEGDYDSLLEKISTPQELSGLLNLALKALHNLLKNRKFDNKADIEETKKMWLISSYAEIMFIEDNLLIEKQDEEKEIFVDPIDKVILFQQYYSMCKSNAVHPSEYSIFNRKLKDHFRNQGVALTDERVKHNGNRIARWTNLVFTEDSEYKICVTEKPKNKLTKMLNGKTLNKRDIFLNVIRKLSIGNIPALIDDIISLSQSEGLSQKDIDGITDRLFKDGTIYEPNPGTLKIMEES